MTAISAAGPRGALVLLFATAAALTACGSSEESASATKRAPARAGEVWEIDQADDRSTAAASLLAYLSGLHVMVLDGKEAYAGMTRLRADREDEGERVFRLADGLEARLAPDGERMELHFSTGERVALRKQARSAKR